jgi:hypothetical protein
MSARADLCGGRSAMIVPTATQRSPERFEASFKWRDQGVAGMRNEVPAIRRFVEYEFNAHASSVCPPRAAINWATAYSCTGWLHNVVIGGAIDCIHQSEEYSTDAQPL